MLIDRPDHELVEAVRHGEIAAFAELWERHSAWALRTAGRFTRWRDHDDVVSEAYTRIFRLLRDGNGPAGPFRPYLYVIIRNLALELESARRATRVFDDDGVGDLASVEDESLENMWDRELVITAFRSLPEQWQRTLWWTEVEGLPPREVGRRLGINANSAAALSYRAREGLRQAWLGAHTSEVPASGDCPWATRKLPAAIRGRLRGRDSNRLSAHLAECPRCRKVESRLNELGSRLASILVPVGLATLASRWPAPVATSGPGALVGAGSLATTPAAFSGGAIGGTVIGGLAAVVMVGVLAGAVPVREGDPPMAGSPVPSPSAATSAFTNTPADEGADAEAPTGPLLPENGLLEQGVQANQSGLDTLDEVVDTTGDSIIDAVGDALGDSLDSSALPLLEIAAGQFSGELAGPTDAVLESVTALVEAQLQQ